MLPLFPYKKKTIFTQVSKYILSLLFSRANSLFRDARRKMCPGAAEEPTVIRSRAGLFWLEKTKTMQDEKVDGEYGLIINGHSLVRRAFSGTLLFLVAAELTRRALSSLPCPHTMCPQSRKK